MRATTLDAALESARLIANISLHRATYVPDNRDAVIIMEKAEELRALENEIDAEISQLRQQKHRIQAQLNVHHALVSPSRRLPFEMLSEIFVLALPEDWANKYAGKRCLNIASVCSSWRAVALNTPRIWTTLKFAVSNPIAKRTAAVKAELDKTAQAPLDLTIDMSAPFHNRLWSYGPTRDDTWSDEAWALLCTQSHRWRRVCLDQIPSNAYSVAAEYAFPALRSLSIALDDEEQDGAHVIPLHIFQNASKVTTLHVCYLTTPINLSLPPTWKITELTITCGDYSAIGSFTPPLMPCFEAILACSCTLRKLIVSADKAGSLPANRGPTTFPALEELRLDDSATSLCLYIQAPHLQTATLSSFPDLEIDALPIFQEFLQNSSGCPSLRSLSLVELRAPSYQVIDCLRDVPQVTDLRLSHTEDTEIGDDSLISPEVADALSRNGCALTPDGGTRRTTTLLPNLLRLTFDVGGTPYEEENEDYRDALRDIVVSRTRSRVVHGVALARLERFSTDAIGYSYPRRVASGRRGV